MGLLVLVESCSYFIEDLILSEGGNILLVSSNKLDKGREENAACQSRAHESLWFREFQLSKVVTVHSCEGRLSTLFVLGASFL